MTTKWAGHHTATSELSNYVEAAGSGSNLRSNYSESVGTKDVSEDIVVLHRNHIYIHFHIININ